MTENGEVCDICKLPLHIEGKDGYFSFPMQKLYFHKHCVGFSLREAVKNVRDTKKV